MKAEVLARLTTTICEEVTNNPIVSKFSTPYRSKIFEAGTSSALVAQPATASPLTGNVNDSLTVTNVDTNQPLQLASQFVDASLLRDKTTPVLEDSSFHGTAVDYKFSPEVDGLGAFTPFVKQELINIPDEILAQYNKVETIGKMGIFPEINRAWVIIDNKLILWNLARTSEFQSFEEIKHTILKVELVKPKPNTFTDAINYLLLISTPSDIHILAVSFTHNTLDLYNTHMSVPTQGLSVDQFVVYEKTGQVFFTGVGDGLHIWELQYSSSADWFNKKCNKRCLTRSSVSSLIPGSSLINSLSNFLGSDDSNETVVQLSVDSSRGIIYTLSNTSHIRAYKISESGSISDPTLLQPRGISNFIMTSSAKSSPLLAGKYLKIVSINVVTRNEHDDLFLVAITLGGCRIYFNGYCTSSTVSSLRTESVKFPPTKMTEEEIAAEQTKFKEQEAMRTTSYTLGVNNKNQKELPTTLMYQKKSGVLYESKAASKIISPGIFFDVVQKEGQEEHKLFVSVPDYGQLKYHNKYAEHATFLDVQGKIHQIVPLSQTFNATDRPRGYANEFATQYTNSNFEVAVLTNTSLVVYRYRTPDQVFESLTDDLTPFVAKYGLLEAASTALYVTCKFSLPKTIRSNAFTFFTVGIPNIVDFKPTYRAGASLSTSLISTALSTKSDSTFDFQNVILSPRFYGIVTLLGRLFRNIWDRKVFKVIDSVKFNKDQTIVKNSIFENEYLDAVNIEQGDLEFFLSSISVLNEFFQTYGNTIACFVPPSFNNRNFDKSEEFCNQAENLAINAVIRLVISIKEALSFLVVLIKEGSDEADGDRLKDVFKYLTLDVQQSLSKLTFKDIFAPNDNTKNLIKEILSSIINRSMSRGESIEYIAKGLQERCGTFCSANDVVGFRAIEHLRKAKEIGFSDYDGLNYHLSRAIELFEAVNNEISLEKLKESIDIMVGLNDFPRAIKFALNISAGIDQGNLAAQYAADGKLPNDERKQYFEKRKAIFEIVFELLVQVDKLAVESNVNQVVDDSSRVFESSLSPMTDFAQLRNVSYDTAFKFEDKLFHYELYDWFISQEVSERLLEIDTPYVLGYLEEKASDSLEISDMLWIYQSKKDHHYQAALISYTLALSDFDITLSQRNEYLSRAIGFCNCTTYPNERQQVIQLSTMIEEVFEASNIQYDLLVTITNDKQIPDDTKAELVSQLNGKILTVSELYNDFANPLSYNEICLSIYKASDFRNSEEIISRWDKLFDAVKTTIYADAGLITDGSDDVILNGTNAEKFVALLSSTVIKVGKKLSSSEFVFPTTDLLPIVTNLIYDIDDADSLVSKGGIVKVFLECGIPYDKLYYILKELIDTNPNDVNSVHYKKELVYLIKSWYNDDIRLREIISNDEVRNLSDYTSATDPISNYMTRTGNSV